MSVVLSELTGYIDQNRDKLIRETILGAKSAKLFNLQTGVKTKTALNLLSGSGAVLQSGTSCGWDDAGTSTVTQRTISAPVLKVNMSFCDKDFSNTVLQYQAKVAAGTKTLPFEAEFINGVLADVALQSEKLIWQGDVESETPELALSDGLMKIITEDVPEETNKVGSTDAITLSTVKAEIDAVYAAIPAAILQKATIFVGYDTFRMYVMALQALNLYHYDPSTSADAMSYPGSVVKIEAVAGLNGTNWIVAGNPEDFFYGTDLQGDYEKFDFWYSQDNQEFRLAVQFTQGVQIAFPSQVIYKGYTAGV